MRRSYHLIPVDLPHEARTLYRGLHVVGKAHILLQAQSCLLNSKIIVDAILERDPDERKAVERCRADDVNTWSWGKANLNRNSVVALHLLGRLARGLRGDFENHRGRIGIGLDV